ncbi:hypothetical protein GQ457_01G007790 [Hibiscus cannabinus]
MALGIFRDLPKRPYDPHRNTYNSGWRDHPNLSYVQYPRSYPTYQPYQSPKSSLEELVERLEQRLPPPQPYHPPKSSLEELVEQFGQSQEKFQDRTRFNSQEIDEQISPLEQAVGRLESQDKLPSQTETNPRDNASAITLRSGTVIEQSAQKKDGTKESRSTDKVSDTKLREEGDATKQKRDSIPEPEQSPYAMQPPFPLKLIKEDKHAEEKKILDVEINLPLLEVIRKMPRYARFLKKLCANKRKFSGHEKVNLGEYVYAVLTRWLPPKFKDQGMFSIRRKIHKISLEEVLSWTKRKKWRKLQCL